MAYAALASLAQTINLILNSHQDSISAQFEDLVISIHRHLIFLQAFLEDFPDKASNLEDRIREVTHVAEDKIEFLWSDALLKSTVGSSKSEFKHQASGKYQHLRYDLHELKKVTKDIESIAEKVVEIKNRAIVKDVRLDDSTAASSSSGVAPVRIDAMVGFDNDLMEIKCRLCRDSSKLEVVPIVGMGGIGKTTLARNVYDDPLIVEYFDIRAWVTISQDYSAREIASDLLVSMKELDARSDSMEELDVYQNLKGRRYLIVLDDIWSIKAWDDLKMMFPDDGNGSRIMLTTRLSDVASYANSFSPIHEMRLMDEGQSWTLLRQEVFKQDPCPAELEYVGKTIARRCRGLPLAIMVISGLLTTDQTKAAWESIGEKVKFAISTNDHEQFDKILALSYTQLPHHLRPCFLYMGCFPEDYKMRVSKLIKLWVAEGFLKPNGNKSSEETAEEYLEDLVKRSLVFITERRSNGRIKSFSIHDLMREMCIRRAQEENFFIHIRMYPQEGTKKPRRASIVHSRRGCLKKFYGSSIRTIIRLEHRRRGTGCILGYFRLLRILDVATPYDKFFLEDENNSVITLPAEVFELFHLRYLALNVHFEIPAAISNLQNLQTLMVRPHEAGMDSAGREIFVWLPREIWRMPQLRHLDFCFALLPFQEQATFALENLLTLSVARNFICTQKILKMVPNLKKLGISYMAGEDDKHIHEEGYQLDNLICLQQLENLKLEIERDFPYREKVNPAFPRTLKKLTLSCWGRPWKDLKIVGSLPNLQVLKLKHYACIGLKWETTEGEFSQLKFLMIDQSNLWHWITESSHFPTLKCLVLRLCRYLRKIPDGIAEIPTLELIKVDDWNGSLVKSAKRIRDNQHSWENYALQIRYIKAHSSSSSAQGTS